MNTKMSEPVDLLLITWNRRQYLEKTLPTILDTASDFRLYCWDNASQDGTADLIKAIDDPRVIKKHFNSENVGQYAPCMWFYEVATSDVIGKIDDDILLPSGWLERFAPMIRKEPRFGMLGCWIFMPEDWNQTVAQQNIIELSNEQIFRSIFIAGHSFLARKEYLRHYHLPKNSGHGLPVDRVAMSLDGLFNGFPIPLLYAHNMDDPRSPLNIHTKSGSLQLNSALTAKKQGFKTAEAYAEWIAADAYFRQIVPFKNQIQWLQIQQETSLIGKIKKKLFDIYFRWQYKQVYTKLISR